MGSWIRPVETAYLTINIEVSCAEPHFVLVFSHIVRSTSRDVFLLIRDLILLQSPIEVNFDSIRFKYNHFGLEYDILIDTSEFPNILREITYLNNSDHSYSF